ncbi:hypothetical protein ABTH88_20180, partial [Acinetobacter baumannii]
RRPRKWPAITLGYRLHRADTKELVVIELRSSWSPSEADVGALGPRDTSEFGITAGAVLAVTSTAKTKRKPPCHEPIASASLCAGSQP